MGYREEVNARIFIYMSFLKDVVKEIGNDYAGILADGSVGDIGGYVDTGSYIFNALVSGSINGISSEFTTSSCSCCSSSSC